MQFMSFSGKFHHQGKIPVSSSNYAE